MKQVIFSFILLTVSLSTRGQEYVPLIDTSRIWNVAELFPHGGGALNYEYLFGDTVTIGNTLYVEVKVNSEVFGYLREDTLSRRVYYRSIWDDESALLYDFSLEEGDTIQLYGDPGHKYTVLQVDSVELLNGDVRKRWIFSLEFYYTNAVWIEGIGNTTIYLLNSGDLDYCTVETVTLCVHENEELVYMNDTFDTCYLDWVNVSETDIESIKVYPNPTKGQITFSIPNVSSHKNPTLHIINSFGQTVKVLCIQEKQTQIDITGLPAGSYFYWFYDGKHQLYAGKIVLH